MTQKLRFSLFIVLLPAWLTAQGLLVWPGDVTGNGRVNNVDLLYFGLAYNYIGPARPDPSVLFEGQPADPWSQTFPNGANMAQADADGNGLVNYYYDFFPLFVHYGLERPGPVTPDVFVPGAGGFDPQLSFVDTAIQNGVYAHSPFKLPLVFGTEELPVEDLYGLCFSVSVDSEYIDAREIEFDLTETSWANPDNDRLFMQKAVSPSRIDVGWVRTDHNQRSGFGRIGEATIIIIIDVIGVQESTSIIFHSIKMIDKFGNEIPVAADTIPITVLPDPLATEAHPPAQSGLLLGPNPAQDYLRYRTGAPVESITFYNALGQRVRHEMPGLPEGRLPLNDLAPGVYFVEVRTRENVYLKTIRIQ